LAALIRKRVPDAPACQWRVSVLDCAGPLALLFFTLAPPFPLRLRHGLVPVANQYPWCSAAWFERTAPAMVKSIYRFKTDQVDI
jgi:hypothetical protein